MHVKHYEELQAKSLVTPKGCWEWLACRDDYGYGMLRQQRRVVRAHILAYELAYGCRNGLCVMHKCDNPPCCNPEHLTLGTRADNNADRDAKGRQVALKGEAHWKVRLSAQAINEIRTRRASGILLRELAADYQTTMGHVSAICSGRARKRG